MDSSFEHRTIFGASRVEERVAFLRSVYLWLMGGFAMAALGALATPFVFVHLLSAFGRFAIFPLLIGFYGTFVWARSVSRNKRWNRVAYAVFTLVSGVIAGIAMVAAAQAAGPGIVLTAFAMTAADFLILSAVAHVSKKDFSFLGSFVAMGLGLALVAMLVGFFVHVAMLDLLISAVVVIACSAKVLWDTSAMLRTGDFGDAAGFALSLFISLLNIFLHLLRLLSGGRRN